MQCHKYIYVPSEVGQIFPSFQKGAQVFLMDIKLFNQLLMFCKEATEYEIRLPYLDF